MNAKIAFLLLAASLCYARPADPAVADSYLTEKLQPYMPDALALHSYAASHPTEFTENDRPEPNVEYYANSASWVKLDKTEFNSYIDRLKRKHHLAGENLELDDDKLFLRVEDTNLFDGLF
ncbi:AGR313W-Ap [Eremothecium gossypii ATCC 10895]|uniref:AGR313W-Ap n=1 Tax=Eremothecium gossypii (strain ATCC 10895 / CBS 109.51 / FGSC 9923 / NRRL Y-1056) TaxID=284811 RepID=D8FGG8_EREGS|nr:AGR313W-Ap [Eremothecium gossypii ATCC 10895]ADJ41745.1 AGR313W-Ap [Eremothecium gossypii ATCC 10895]AEY99135.1 FAGR313W-Ap [Eremothecium gossypii FDAG1]